MSTHPMLTRAAYALARTGSAVLLVLFVALPASAQIPDTFTNLQVLPEDISRDSLIQIMRNFSFALGVRCQYCHVGGDGISFEGVEFDKDTDPDKRKARFMMRMVENLNGYVLPLTPERDTPAVVIECKTCHRGLPRPLLLKQDLLMVTHKVGVDSAVQRYRHLREEFALSGSYDFDEWETNQLAEQLEAEGRIGDAIAIYKLNSEFYPASVSIAANLARLYESEGDRSAAIRYYERVLELRPEHRGAQDRLEALRAR